MNGKDLAGILNGRRAGQALETLYGSDDVERERRRYITLAEGVPSEIGAGGVRVFSAPGRTELGGNHTDHNRGRVLAAAVQMDAVAVAAPTPGGKVFFRSTGFPDVEVNLFGRDGRPDLSPHPEEEGTTEALVRGIASEFEARGVRPGGFFANASSTVLKGSGLSSSAALEVLLAKIFDSLYGEGRLPAVELAQIGQKAENVFFGKPCGLMDQAASAFGGAVAIDFAAPITPVVNKIEFDPLTAGFTLCVVNTKGDHADLTPDYAAVPQEMTAVARFFGKSFLRELDLASVLARAGDIRKALGDRALLRAIHFFNENRRVGEMAELLQKNAATADAAEKQQIMAGYLDLVNESGDSSWELLQNIYSPRDTQKQEMSLALAVTREFFRENGIPGACRVHGGGFAGTIQAYVPVSAVDGYKAKMETLFGSDALTVLRVRQTGVVEVVKSEEN